MNTKDCLNHEFIDVGNEKGFNFMVNIKDRSFNEFKHQIAMWKRMECKHCGKREYGTFKTEYEFEGDEQL